MSKPEELKQESINQQPNKDIEYVEQEVVILPDYTYGIENEQLDYNTALRNIPTNQTGNSLLLMGA